MTIAFLSYAEQDNKIAKKISSDLTDHGVKIWFDQQEILVGDSLIERIKEGINRADYLLVLLSKNSNQSNWVRQEIGVAFERFKNEETTAIIPIQIDDTPVPEKFQNIRYVSLSSGYENAINEIIQRIKRDCKTKVDLEKVINTDELAADIAAERKVPRGSEFYITSILGILTIISALVTAYPSFVSTFSRVPKVYYDIRNETISYPTGTDEKKALLALESAGIAPAAVRIRLINKGKAPAKIVKIGSKTTGKFLYINSLPTEYSKTVWVKVKQESFNPGDKEAVIQLKELSPEKKVIIDLGYKPPHSETESDIVVSGIFAEKVQNVDHIPQWTLWKALVLPLQILFFGLLISIIIGVGIAARNNPRLRAKLFELLEAISPAYASILKIVIK